MIRKAIENDVPIIFEIINDAAQAYKGIIPADRWHEPYMPMTELEEQIRGGVEFRCFEEDGEVTGIMGIQDKGDVSLIRHAYVRTKKRNSGIGTRLLHHLCETTAKPVLIGTWEAASWAIGFYEKNGFVRIEKPEKDRLLKKYWEIPDRQVETSVVLADKRWVEKSLQTGQQPKDEIKIEYQPELKLLLEAYNFYSRSLVRRKIDRLIGGAAAIIGAFLLYRSITPSADLLLIIVSLVIIAAGASEAFGLIDLGRIGVANDFKNNPKYRENQTIVFDNKGLHYTINNAASEIKWAFYKKYVESPNAFILVYTKYGYSVIPKTAFLPDQIENFRRLLKEKINEQR